MSRRDRGSALFIAMLVVMVVSALSLIVISDSVAKAKDAELEINNVRALYVAESAIDMAMNNIQTGGNGRMGTTVWALGNDNGMDGNGATLDAGQGDKLPTVGEPNVVLQNFPGTDNGQYYTFAQYWGNDGIDNDGDGLIDAADTKEIEIWTVWAWGRHGNTIRRIKVIAEYHVVDIWDNAIIAGHGAAGATINGNATVHGGILIFAEDSAGVPTLTSAQDAFIFSGTGGVQDNYLGLDAANIAKMRPIGKGKAGLNTFVRIKHGKAGLSGTGTLGDPALGAPDDPTTIANDQEMVDGIFINDGYDGNQGVKNVFSENGPYNPFDLPAGTQFPRLADPYFDPKTGITFANYQTYADSQGMDLEAVMAGGLEGKNGGLFNLDKNTADFGPITDAKGNSIKWIKATQTLEITGLIQLKTTTQEFQFGTKSNPITYKGRGSIYQSGPKHTHVHANIIPNGEYLTNDVLGFVAKNDLYLADGAGDAQLSMFGIWYAGNQIKSQKQNQIMGSFMSEYFDMGANVPQIAHHPDVGKNLPVGMMARTPVHTTLFIDAWGEW